LAVDPQLCQSLAARGRVTIEKSFTHAIYIHALEAFYDRTARRTPILAPQ
jgi:hypothetical protein